MPAAGFTQRPAAHYVAAALAVAHGQMGITRAAREHNVNRHTLGARLRDLIDGGAISPPKLTEGDKDSLGVVSNGLAGVLCKIAKGAYDCLVALPARPDHRTKEEMKAFDQAMKTLDRLGLMPAKPKDEAKASESSRFIDLVEQREEAQPEPPTEGAKSLEAP